MKQLTRVLLVSLFAGLAALGLLAFVRGASLATEAGRAAPVLSAPEPDVPAADQSYLHRLTHDGRSTPLAWTSDGETLLVKRPGKVLPGQQLSELWALSVGEQGEHRISENAFRPAVYAGHVAYLRFANSGQWEAMQSDLTGGGTRALGLARWTLPPTWVDGQILFLEGSGQLLASGGPTASWLTRLNLQGDARVRLSHDGQHLATTDGQNLWSLGRAGRVQVASADRIHGFAWSPVAARLAYVRTEGGPMPQLWVWDAASGRSWMLLGLEMAHLGVPVWSPDGERLAFTYRPTGNAGVAGDIWLVHADGTGLHPMALTPADEYAPCWSPDGQELAFALEGDVWIADPEAPGIEDALGKAIRAAKIEPQFPIQVEQISQVAPQSLTAPITIRVMHDDQGNTCRDVPDGQIDTYPFEDYVKRVVPNEVPAYWPTETLKAQAAAARTYAWRKALNSRWPYDDPGYDVWDSTRDQYMCDNPHPLTDAAADATEGQYVSYNDKVIYAFFCAEAGSPTNYRQQLNLVDAPYLRPIDDPVSFGQTRNGHSWGMSQWGAYRWAAWHGWDYQQILAHYYSFATIQPSDTFTEPLAGLALPWPGSYVNTAHAYLQANAADDSTVVTVTFSARITDTWTTIYTDTGGSDSWAHVWPVGDVTDTITPSIALRVTVQDDAGHATESRVSYIGVDRVLPTGTLGISNAVVYTRGVTLRLDSSDPETVSNTIRAGLGSDGWVWEDTELYYLGGVIETDSTAGDGSAWHAGTGVESVLFGPYTTILPAGSYRALFRVRAPTAALTSSQELVSLEVTADAGASLLGIHYVRGTDFRPGDAFQDFAVDFVMGQTEVEFRSAAYGLVDLWVDRVRIVSYPVQVPAQIDWLLPAREGPVTVTASYVDRAGNLSEDISLALTLIDDSHPGGWQQLHCGGMTCTVQVRDEIAGLDVGSAEYRISSAGSTLWSEWLPATCTGAAGSHDWETITTGIFPASPEAEGTLIQFRIRDCAVAPNTGTSPAYRVQRVFLPQVIRERP